MTHMNHTCPVSLVLQFWNTLFLFNLFFYHTANYLEGSSFEVNSSVKINGKFTIYNVEPFVVIHCKTCMLFCYTAVGKEIPNAVLANPQAVSFLCITSINIYESFAVIRNKIIYTGIKLTFSNVEPLVIIQYNLCNVSTDSSLCQIVPLVINKIQT